jgi:L-alanine-DL-glutamate epimerase-like enolase superfamily enzyme
MYLEYLPLWEPLFVESLEISRGLVSAPQGPGLGLTLDWDFVDDHRVA